MFSQLKRLAESMGAPSTAKSIVSAAKWYWDNIEKPATNTSVSIFSPPKSSNPAAGNNAQSRNPVRRHVQPVGDQATLDESIAPRLDPREIRAAPKAHVRRQSQRPGHAGGHRPHPDQTGVSRLRPLRRRRARIARPLRLELRFRKPCCRTRLVFEGWNVRFISC